MVVFLLCQAIHQYFATFVEILQPQRLEMINMQLHTALFEFLEIVIIISNGARIEV